MVSNCISLILYLHKICDRNKSKSVYSVCASDCWDEYVFIHDPLPLV